MYGLAPVTTKKFADENQEIVRGVCRKGHYESMSLVPMRLHHDVAD
jgi:hypothetical protein